MSGRFAFFNLNIGGIMKNYIKINDNDNVIVALLDIPNGSVIEGVTAIDDIPKGHKMAMENISENQNVIKYGYPIGHATKEILKGQHVHVQNVKTNLDDTLTYTYNKNLNDVKNISRTFKGYVRENGKVGIRNEIWVINTVGCINKSAEKIVQKSALKYENTENFDGVHTFVHPYGCSQMGDDHETTQKILARLVEHPNTAGVLVLSLGCENNNLKEFTKVLGETNGNRVKFLVAQDVEDEISAGMEIIDELVTYAKSLNRVEVPLSELTIGLKCGGSDGLSGITANPLVGRISDLIIGAGGTSILSEVPEMFGAETILMNRCITEEKFNDTVSLINNFKDYYKSHNQTIYENPSPGNKAGGITTLEDKSLGCTQKGGSANVVNVLSYGEVSNVKGLNLLQGPGNDIVACTALSASGANLVLFTTGRGTPLGGPTPTVKIATNYELFNHKNNWCDFNAARVLDETDMDTLALEFLDYIIKVASGEIHTKNEINDFREIAIFKDGVTL